MSMKNSPIFVFGGSEKNCKNSPYLFRGSLRFFFFFGKSLNFENILPVTFFLKENTRISYKIPQICSESSWKKFCQNQPYLPKNILYLFRRSQKKDILKNSRHLFGKPLKLSYKNTNFFWKILEKIIKTNHYISIKISMKKSAIFVQGTSGKRL